jgi:hypothetical protein
LHPATSPVSGSVSYKGSPVDGATVVFTPLAGGHPATATTDSQGKFRLSTYAEFDGAVAGDYRVTVTKIKDESAPKSEAQLHEEAEQQAKTGKPLPAPVVKYLVPQMYMSVEKTPLKFTVKPGQNEEAKLDLAD